MLSEAVVGVRLVEIALSFPGVSAMIVACTGQAARPRTARLPLFGQCRAAAVRTRLAPRWARSAPRSRSTSPRAEAFAAIADLARRPSFTDHFLTDFRLTRIESTGSAPGRASASGRGRARSGWTRRSSSSSTAPDRRARPRRARQPDPGDHGLGAARGPGLADQGPRLPLDRAVEPGRPRARGAARRRRLAGAALARGAAPPARPARVRRAAAGARGGRRRQPHATGIP